MRFKSVKLLGMVVTGRTMVVTLVEVMLVVTLVEMMLVVMMEVMVEVTLVEVVRMSEDSNNNNGCDAAHSSQHLLSTHAGHFPKHSTRLSSPCISTQRSQQKQSFL